MSQHPHPSQPQTPLFFLSTRGVDPSDGRRIRRDAERGSTRRIRNGVYIPSRDWAELDARHRHLALVRGVAETHRQPVIAHASAAAMWGMPMAVGGWPPTVHVVVEPSSNARSKNGVTVHREAIHDGDVVELDGILVTSPARTLIDLARTLSFGAAVAALDHALNPRRAAQNAVSADALRNQLDGIPTARGRARANRALAFARPLVDNAGETLSRIAIAELGFPEPVLQRQHVDPRGGYYYTDFEWPGFKTIAEFDGRGKYLKEEYLRGRAPGEVVHEEKIREDHLRAEGNAVARWGPPELRVPAEIARRLVGAGLPPPQQGRFASRLDGAR